MLQELTQEIERTVRSMINEVHTALPGKIVSLDVEKGTVTVKPIGKFVTSNQKSLEYPELSEVPFVFPYSKQVGIGIYFPIKAGDTCLIIISEVELDEWRNGAESEGSLRFDLTNAIAIPSLLQSGNDFMSEAIKKEAVVIATSESKVLVSKDSVDISIGENKVSIGKDGMDIEIGDIKFVASKLGITVRGDFKVEGNISYTETLKKVIQDD